MNISAPFDGTATGERLSEILGLRTHPVAVFFLKNAADKAAFADWPALSNHRYCQALMKARRGEAVLLDAEGISCPAAAAAFGFRSLPDGLAGGKGLVGFGIVRDSATGRRMFEGMTRFAPGEIVSLALCPLSEAPRTPDVVVVEDEVERLMWLLLADLNLAGGTRRRGDTAVLQATCVDSTIIPYMERRMNFCLGCYGCREATDIGPGETVLGFPGVMLDDLVGALEHLAEKAIPRSREKPAYKRLDRPEAGVDIGHREEPTEDK